MGNRSTQDVKRELETERELLGDAVKTFRTKAGSDPFSRTSSAEADEPASESEPRATTSSSGWRSTRSRVSCPEYPEAPRIASVGMVCILR